MYHDFAGREVEDLEGDAMRRDARKAKIKSHQQTIQLINGREITRTVFGIEGTALYQQGSIWLNGQQVHVYRADDEGPIWHEDVEKSQGDFATEYEQARAIGDRIYGPGRVQ